MELSDAKRPKALKDDGSDRFAPDALGGLPTAVTGTRPVMTPSPRHGRACPGHPDFPMRENLGRDPEGRVSDPKGHASEKWTPLLGPMLHSWLAHRSAWPRSG